MRSVFHWSLRTRITVLSLVAGLLLGGLAIATAIVATENRRQVDFLIETAQPLRINGDRLLATLINQETGVRGFALTGRVDFLEPYDTGVAEEKHITGVMELLLADQPRILAHLHDVGAAAQRWRSTTAEPVLATVRSTGPEAGQKLINEESRQRFEQVRTAVATMQAETLALRSGAVEEVQQTGDTLTALLIAAAAVVVLTGAALMWLLHRLVIAPVTTLATQVRAVAGGDYDRPIVVDAVPELTRLAEDVNGMRYQIAADLTEVQQARQLIEQVNAQLEAQTSELTRSNRDLEQFAYVASHDLQEPLRKVASFCQLLQRRYAGQLDERADQYIAFAVDGAQRMQRLINDLLDFSRIGRVMTDFTDVDLAAVMGEVSSQLEATRKYASATITWADLPVVRGEETLITTLLANLVGNAIKFRRPDTPPRVHISARQVDAEWEITCRDNGIGIEYEFAEKIFVIFQRLHAKDAYPGTGIGLAIAKKIAEYHGGRIWVHPDAGDGAVISFTIPIPIPDLSAPALAADATAPVGDDDPDTAPQSPPDAPAQGSTTQAKEPV